MGPNYLRRESQKKPTKISPEKTQPKKIYRKNVNTNTNTLYIIYCVIRYNVYLKNCFIN